jgi:hypothetical protein
MRKDRNLEWRKYKNWKNGNLIITPIAIRKTQNNTEEILVKLSALSALVVKIGLRLTTIGT